VLEPAIVQHVPVLAKVKAPRVARPLRAAALTSAARRDGWAVIAGAGPGVAMAICLRWRAAPRPLLEPRMADSTESWSGDDFDAVAGKPVDDAIGIDHNFANDRIVSLGHYAP